MRFLSIDQSPAFHLEATENWVGLLAGLIVFVIMDIILCLLFRRTLPRIILVVIEAAMVLCWLFGLPLPLMILGIALIAAVVFFFIANQSETRVLCANNMVGKSTKGLIFHKRKKKAEFLFDREAIYKEVADAVVLMSKQKVGAIIVFEKNDSLTEFCRTGTMIDAPVTSELIETIFYKGTRLHDGAVIIRNDKILAAAVALPSTNRALSGKYGMRHRAALGISEQVDAVTVIVSEETGRISIAYQGDLESVLPDDFLARFDEYMSMNSVLERVD